MIEVTVNAYAYKELGESAKENADYGLEHYVDMVYNYNLDLLKQERLGNKVEVKEELEKKKLEIDKVIDGYCQVIKVDMETTGTVNSSTVAKLLAVTMDRERVVASIEELDKDIKDTKNMVNRMDLEKEFPFAKVISLFSSFNGIYFTFQGYPLLKGVINTRIPLK